MLGGGDCGSIGEGGDFTLVGLNSFCSLVRSVVHIDHVYWTMMVV